mmetsp:Transcript_68726/g.148304  ORF Transcript_68726/g.148304 Transcript_68726/m.148304 type:complete len:107 (+) Transcript_68726:173-493(+)
MEEWPRGHGLLTEEGIKQCAQLGFVLRNKMIAEYKLLDTKINIDQIDIWSTDKHRVKESAQIFLKNFMLKNSNSEIKVIDKKNDYFLGDKVMKCEYFKKFRKLNEE